MSEIYEKKPEHQGSEVSMTREEICVARKTAFGLSACHDCPCSCSVSGENANRLFNLFSASPEAFPDVDEYTTPARKNREKEKADDAQGMHDAYETEAEAQSQYEAEQEARAIDEAQQEAEAEDEANYYSQGEDGDDGGY